MQESLRFFHLARWLNEKKKLKTSQYEPSLTLVISTILSFSSLLFLPYIFCEVNNKKKIKVHISVPYPRCLLVSYRDGLSLLLQRPSSENGFHVVTWMCSSQQNSFVNPGCMIIPPKACICNDLGSKQMGWLMLGITKHVREFMVCDTGGSKGEWGWVVLNYIFWSTGGQTSALHLFWNTGVCKARYVRHRLQRADGRGMAEVCIT